MTKGKNEKLIHLILFKTGEYYFKFESNYLVKEKIVFVITK